MLTCFWIACGYIVLFEDDGNSLIKKIAGYHQFYGVRVTTIAAADSDEDAVRERRATYGDEVQPGLRKAGVFWHTQGSGKSISMCCYAGKLLPRFLSGKALAAGLMMVS